MLNKEAVMTHNNISGLEEMKQQMALLKQKLEQQKIVNEKVLRSAMKKKFFGLNKRVRMIFVLGIFVAFWAPAHFSILGASNWFCGATFAILLFCALKTFLYQRKLWRLNFAQTNLLELSQELTLLRTRYKKWYKTALLMIVPWFVWLSIEIYLQQGPDSLWLIGGCLIGGIIGGLIGTRINNNIIRRTDELLEQIEEYRNL